MKFYQCIKTWGLTLWILLCVMPLERSRAESARRTPGVIVWDTLAPLDENIDLQARDKWRAVPSDLLTLEANYAAAASDPAYYGRAYAFQGDAVLEGQHAVVVLPANRGRTVVYAKADGQEKFEFVPLQLKHKAARIESCSLQQNAGDEAAVEVRFSAEGVKGNLSMVLSLGRSGVIAVKPGPGVRGLSIFSSIACGVTPHFIGDDLIYDPGQYPALNRLCVPCENLLLGLLHGQEDMLVMTWPQGNQEVTLTLDHARRAQALIESVDLRHDDGQSLYLGLIHAPGVWHREALTGAYLERTVTSDWRRPFSAKWKTQLLEGGIETTFTFKESKQDIWRGAIGFYTYPVWFEGDRAVYRLSKKIPPKGESIVYFTERSGTPPSVYAPVDLMRDSLGRATCDAILDVSGRTLRTHHRRGGAGVRRACTCGCTAAIEEVFKAGQEIDRSAYVEGAVDDMVYFVTRHVGRIEEYQAFARDMTTFLERSRQTENELKSYVDPLLQITRELQEEYNRARENMKTLDYADQLARKTKALTHKQTSGNLDAGLELCRQWRAMGGAQDDVLAQSHRIVRRLFQAAGYGCVDNPQAVAPAREIMSRCRQCLRNPDGYEIWPNY